MRKWTLFAMAVAMVVASAGTAAARSHLDPEEEIPTLSFFFDPVLATLYFDVFDPTVEDDDLVNCTVAPAPADCLPIVVREPVNHGAVVSSFVHALKENPDLWSGPKGCLVSQVAQSDAGKAATDGPSADGTDGEEPKPDRCAEKVERKVARTEAKAERRAGTGQPGPPSHANSKGRKG